MEEKREGERNRDELLLFYLDPPHCIENGKVRFRASRVTPVS